MHYSTDHFPHGRDLIEDGPPLANNQQQFLFDGYSNIYPVADYNMWALSARIVEGEKITKQKTKVFWLPPRRVHGCGS